jgi:hypothetical protein
VRGAASNGGPYRDNRRSGDQLQRKVDPPPRHPARCHANTPRRTRGWRRRGGDQAARNDPASGNPDCCHPEISARARAIECVMAPSMTRNHGHRPKSCGVLSPMGGMSRRACPPSLRGAPGRSSRQSRRFALAGRSSYSKGVDAGWSSSVARWAHNPEVVGSNPTPATKVEAGSEQGSGLLLIRMPSGIR